MLDFLMISTRSTRRGAVEVYPKFLIRKSKDLMIRGGDFYAVWIEEHNAWSTDEHDAIDAIDAELYKYVEENKGKFEGQVIVKHMWDASSGMIDEWHKYCQRQMRDSFKVLDEKLIFANMATKKTDYVTKKLSYPLEPGDFSHYNKLMSTLYSPKERRKIEWAIGAVVSGESVRVQKFVVLYGSAGTGKSTILNIIQKLFDGYYSVFDAKALGSTSNAFALEAFKTNPLVAIQHDGDLSKIGDNTRLNSLVSHEMMTVNEKFKSAYATRFKSFLFMGTNKPVQITDAKSGLIRRLIDVAPSGKTLPPDEYRRIVEQMDFELGAIAYHCQEVYISDPSYYDTYIPTNMLGASNDFYNFIEDSYYDFKEMEGVSLKAAWEKYNVYCEDAQVLYKLPKRAFKEELRNYFQEYKDRHTLMDGTRVRSYFLEFLDTKFEQKTDYDEEPYIPSILLYNSTNSKMDSMCKDCPAQYASEEGSPILKWKNVQTKLSELDTSKLHYVQVPENHIVIDFDIVDATGEKSLELNLREAAKFPKTYTEVSKSGNGVHLHYIFSGDVNKLSRVYDDHIEVKVFTGNASLRRMLTLCNEEPISIISSGLPLKGGTKKMISSNTIKSERGLRKLIERNINKEIHPGTKPSIDFIHKILEDAYAGELKYDISDMRNVIFAFAASSTNQAEYCINLIDDMKFKSHEPSTNVEPAKGTKMIFYDVEVFPNLFIVNWKAAGKDQEVVRMINPSAEDIESLIRFNLVGFNCRRYDNHIMYGRLIGYDNAQLYELSQKIINNKPNAYFGEAYNLSYTDVFDFSSKRQSLKKWQIELGIHHKELGLPWDEPVPEELWVTVAEYCDNDVISTEAVFDHIHSDFIARQILADIAGMTVNDTTNSLSTRIIFGKERQPQASFNYRDLGEIRDDDCNDFVLKSDGKFYPDYEDDYTRFTNEGQPIFPGYEFKLGKSLYRGEEVGEGGYVYSEPGMYGNVALLDIASMHPTSIIEEELFGSAFTAIFKQLVDARLAIKHNDIKKAKTMLNGALGRYLEDDSFSTKDLSTALKIVVNSVYGLTSARFDNPFRDPRNLDNIVAKRGALFMVNLKHAVQERGFTVAHIKTDSIKIPDATPEIIQFITDYGEAYGYIFEHEATFDRLCLINDAVYIARFSGPDGEWTATGTQFAVPYVFKTLFSKDDIVFDDLCETKAVTTALYLDFNEDLDDVKQEEKERLTIWNRALDQTQLTKTEAKEVEQRLAELDDIIEKGHNYKFVGKVGQFTPILPGFGGGHILRKGSHAKTGKDVYHAASGTKGFRWKESELVKTLEFEEQIDRSYYDILVDKAVSSIAKFGDVEWFLAEEQYKK